MLPKVAVLLACYNGEKYIYDQIESVVRQRQVKVQICISDDGSIDKTLCCVNRAARAFRCEISRFYGCRHPELARRNSANNFYYLIDTASLSPDVEWVAFSDQDDIWDPLHLARAICLISERGFSGYSSSVMAFWAGGRRRFVKKHGIVSRYNHLFEAPGPGCSFVLPRASFDGFQSYLSGNLSAAARVYFHDWAVFAYVRAFGGEWYIDSFPSLLYRQHDSNVLGVQLTPRAISRRLAMLFGGWYRAQCLAVADFVGQSDVPPALLLRRFSLFDRLMLVFVVFANRRRLRDRLTLPFAFLLMMKSRNSY